MTIIIQGLSLPVPVGWLLSLNYSIPISWMQGVTQDLETGGQNWGFFQFRGSKVSSYPIYKNDHSNLIQYIDLAKQNVLLYVI